MNTHEEILELIKALEKKIDGIIERIDNKPRYAPKFVSEGKKPSRALKRP